jgi:hypothetical protein
MEFSRSLSREGCMKKARFTDSQIITVLKLAEAGRARAPALPRAWHR